MNNESNPIEYPVRANRYMFLMGYCSRRKADEMIKNGHVQINGKLAVLGQKINETDKVEISDRVKKMPVNYEYHLLNKPRGVVSHNSQSGEQSAEDFFKDGKKKNLAPVGRLDKDSEGLLFLTNDGRIMDKMLNPKYSHEKEYIVKVDKKIKESFVNKMSKGVNIEGYVTKPAEVKLISEKTFSIILTEGKKHQIRRMCAALGYQVRNLKRTRIKHLRLSGLPSGKTRSLTTEEKIELLKGLDLI